MKLPIFACLLLQMIVLTVRASDPVPAHPFLLVNATQISQIKNQIKEPGFKQRTWQQLQREADKFLKQETEIPMRGGNWEHYYINPLNGNPLVTGKLIGDWQWEHIDTATKQMIKSDSTHIQNDLDGVVVSLIHDTWAIGALQLGLAWQISGNESYARKAKEILLTYASFYKGLPARNKKGDSVLTFTGKGKVHVQNLNEAIWLIDMLQSADLIWTTLSDPERDSVARNLFYPAAEVINEEKAGILNIQCWKNAATGMAGFLLNDKRLIAKAMTDTATGYFAQFRKGVTIEGIWIDRSPSYHFYALNAMVLLAQAARNYGYHLSLLPLRKMFTGPLLMANAGLSIPPFNDSKTVSLYAGESHLYEWAYAEFKDNRFAYVLNTPSRGEYRNMGPSFTGWALLFGVPVLTADKELPNTSKNFPEAGIGMLSRGHKKNNLTCYIKFNLKNTGAHTHWDALDVVVCKGAEYITVIPGAENYASPAHANWHKTTIAHNTFVINQRSQRVSTGKILSSGRDKNFDYVMVETDNAYDSLRYIRTACLLSTNLVLIADQIQLSNSPRPVDLAFHLAGKWKSNSEGQPWQPPAVKGYSYMTNATITAPVTESYASTQLRSGRIVMQSAAASSPMSVIKGYGIPYMNQPLPFAIYRMMTNNALFVTCLALDGQKIKIQIETAKDHAGNEIPVTNAYILKLTAENGQQWKIIVNPDKMRLAAGENDVFKVELTPGDKH